MDQQRQKNIIQQIRSLMKQQHVDMLIIRSTDEYFNEYVPKDQSSRVFATGFTGSMGDAILGLSNAKLFVDGRYSLQARIEAPEYEICDVKLGKSIESSWTDYLASLEGGVKHVGYDPKTMSVALWKRLSELEQKSQFQLVALKDWPVDAVRASMDPVSDSIKSKLWHVDEQICGESSVSKLKRIKDVFYREKLDGFLSVPLDEIAWLTNARGNDFPFQTTFASRALVFNDKLFVASKHTTQKGDGIEFVGSNQLFDALKQTSNKVLRIGIDPNLTPVSMYNSLKESKVEPVFIPSPLQAFKAKKNNLEIQHMRQAFRNADHVVTKTCDWVREKVCSGQKISEADVVNYVTETFYSSGAIALSFNPICAQGKNGAIIHYGTPDPETPIERGTMFLLDTGAYYEGGYATDLTRTFFVGNAQDTPTKYQQFLFTLVLKGAIAGMSARFPKGTVGSQVDALVRAPLWQHGLNFEHGTGHGVGINVHESPTRIAPMSSMPIEVGHVFSIEPGVYLKDFGGVRIENLCTVVEDPEHGDYLCVVPLTFAPIDNRLIDYGLLSDSEKQFLHYFARGLEQPIEENYILPPRG